MNNESISNNSQLSKEQIEKIQADLCLALIGQPDSETAINNIKKYYTKNKSLFDINKPLPSLGSFTPLCASCWFGFSKAVEFLLNNGANPNFTIDDEAIPLHLAAANGHELSVLLLLKAGAEIDKPSKNGQTAFMRACETESTNILKIFFDNGLNIMPDIMKKTNDNKTALDYALVHGNYNHIKIIQYYKLKKVLVPKNIDSKRTKI